MAAPLPASASPHSLRHAKPLEGVRVLDLTRLLPGPFATLTLADLGAVVDKLEDPAPGDYLRNMPPLRGHTGAAFDVLNRDKRSIVLDLKHPDGAATLLRLVRSYDVVLEGFRPGVLNRLGAGHTAMLDANPRLIICAITGYGQTGPMAHRAGHDINYLARAGVFGATGPSGAAPTVSGVQMADVAGGAIWAVSAILAGLLSRARTGRGGVADISMSEGSIALGAFAVSAALGDGVGFARGESALDGGIAPYNLYATADGETVALGALEPKFWIAFATAVGLDPSMDALVPGAHQTALKADVARIIASHPRAYWEAFAAKTDCCLEVVLHPRELATDAHHQARGVFFDVTDDVRGPLAAFRTPLGAGADSAHTAAREAGADTTAVLQDAGFDAGEIASLKARGVVREG